MVEVRDLRSYQKQAKEAGELAKWPKECIESERKFGQRVARLYPLIGLPGGVSTPEGQGTLFNARSDGCQVALTRGKASRKRRSGKKYRPLREYPVEVIESSEKGATK